MDQNTLSLPLIADSDDKSSILKNRIRKNYRHLRKWAKRTNTNCFRIYDRDIKEYPLAVDFYAGRFCVQHFSFDREDEEIDHEFLKEVNDCLCSLFSVDEKMIYWRSRIRRRKSEQYEKKASDKEFFTVLEHSVKFKINLTDYLDTGLFLDHRTTRQLVANIAKDKKLLNLFAYTCSFSVHAAVKGALFTKSVDLSNTYTAWGRENFALNSLDPKKNIVLRDDCLKFLENETGKYDIIVIDPPTISRSKKMEEMFDIQLDYIPLLKNALRLLEKDGVIFFSTNSRKFQFDLSLFPKCLIKDISHKTLPIDFSKKKIHQCWMIKKLKSC